MHRRLFQHLSAGRSIHFVHQRRVRSGQENIRAVVIHLDVHAPDERALRQMTQQRPQVDETRVQVLVEYARF